MASKNQRIVVKPQVKAVNKVLDRQMAMLEQKIATFNESVFSRAEWIRQLMNPDEEVDFNAECGYPSTITPDHYRTMYADNALARKAVALISQESWQADPTVTETPNQRKESPFEKKLYELEEEMGLWSYFHRADTESGVNRFGGLLVGYDDGLSLDKPVGGINDDGTINRKTRKDRKILYFRVFQEQDGMIEDLENRNCPRIGLPKFYNIQFMNPDNPDESTKPIKVHWSRFLPFHDFNSTSEIYSYPRMKGIFPQLWDTRKISGGSAEMFWKGAFPGYAFEAYPELAAEGIELDEESVKEQFSQYYKKLKRYLAMVGGTVKSLAPNITDPKPHLEVQLQLMAIGLDVPYRIWTGSEAGHLASEQDVVTWNKKIGRRHTKLVNPKFIRPGLRHFQNTGVLPLTKDMFIAWPDLNSLSEKDQADVSLKKTQALMQYTTGGLETIIPPIEYFVHILGFTPEQAQQCIKLVVSTVKSMKTGKVWMQPPAQPGGSKSTKSPTKKTGRSRNAQG